MPDHFALLNEPRRPWLDAEILRQKFLALSATLHPDRVHNLSEAERNAAQQRYTELNAAYQSLRHPKDRLRHLLELELGGVAKEIQNVPTDQADLFFEIGKIFSGTDTFLTQKNAATSPMLKVRLFEESQQWTHRLQELQQNINQKMNVFLDELKTKNEDWERAVNSNQREALLGRLEKLYRHFSYFSRWSEQIQERIAQLSF